jgi:hypothetical protein
MKNLFIFIFVALLSACAIRPTDGQILGRLAEIRAMPCPELRAKRNEYIALTKYEGDLAAKSEHMAHAELAGRCK